MAPSAEQHHVRIAETGDGSTTLYSEQFSQHYHNPNGAVAESRHVFFDIPGVPAMIGARNHLTVFETGFGTGLNLILMKDYLETSGTDCEVLFRSVEAFPIDPGTAGKLDFGEGLEPHRPNIILSEVFGNLKEGVNRFDITDKLKLELFCGTFDEMPLSDEPVDVFFHDPFSPEVNAELWAPGVFKKLVSIAKPNAVLSTYCAASSARAAMAAAGWKVARAPGTLGKREMTLASQDENRLIEFKRLNETRLIKRLNAGDFKVSDIGAFTSSNQKSSQ